MKALGPCIFNLLPPLVCFCIVTLSIAQTPKDALDSLAQKSKDFSLTLPYIDSVIVAHPELQKHPILLYCKGRLFFNDENYALAIEYYLEAKNGVKDYELHFDILNNLGTSYVLSKQHDLAISAYE
jgi:tetratricopeptide (TPR) repeat protein